MTIKINPIGWREMTDNLSLVLDDIVKEGVKAGKKYIHVRTGRLLKSIRSSPETLKTNVSLTKKIIAGGTMETGWYTDREDDLGLKPVDYALTEEMRHPQLRTYVPPAIKRAVRDKNRSRQRSK